MADTKNDLPEGTDTVIAGAGTSADATAGRSGTPNQGGSTSSTGNSTGGRTSTTSSDQTDALITGGGSSTGAPNAGTSSSDDSGSSGSTGGVRGLISNATTKVKDEAGTRARGFVGQGLQQGGTTLTNIASLVEDTVEQIGERLGPQYADYARTASQTLNRYATTLQNKDPDELVDDARDFIRKSPSVALGAAAVVGFGLVRLIKAGLPEEGSSGTRNRNRDRSE